MKTPEQSSDSTSGLPADLSTDARPSAALAPPSERRYTLRERIMLTYRYHGGPALALRVLTLPLRLTPLRSRLRHGGAATTSAIAAATRWYRANGRPVTIVIPSYGTPRGLGAGRAASAARPIAERVRSSSATTQRSRSRRRVAPIDGIR